MIDTRTRRNGLALNEHDGLVPVLERDFLPPWDLAPKAPFRTQAWHEANKIWPVWRATDSFDSAMQAAVQTLGPGEGAAMVVLDEGFHVVFGYVSFAEMLVEFGAPAWYGCRAGYAWLEEHSGIPAMDLAVWESTAKGSRC